MGKCSKCGKPTSEGSDLCGFCKISATGKKKESTSSNAVVMQNATTVIDNENFSSYDDVKASDKRVNKKKDDKVSERKSFTSSESAFSKYDVVEKAVKEVETTETSYSGSGFGGVSAISGIAVATLMFLLVLTVYGQVSSSLNTAVIGSSFGPATMNLINLVPLILVGAAIIGIITMAFRLSS